MRRPPEQKCVPSWKLHIKKWCQNSSMDLWITIHVCASHTHTHTHWPISWTLWHCFFTHCQVLCTQQICFHCIKSRFYIKLDRILSQTFSCSVDLFFVEHDFCFNLSFLTDILSEIWNSSCFAWWNSSMNHVAAAAVQVRTLVLH